MSRPSFLDLPLQLRHRIYSYAGTTDTVIDLSWQITGIFHVGPDGELEESTYSLCWHDADYTIIRHEDYYTLEQNWVYDNECEPRGPSIWDFCCENEKCFAWDSCFALLFTCRKIFFEARKQIYSQNRFLLDRSGPRGFQPFLKLGLDSVRALTHLTIRLDGEPPEKMDMSLHWTRTSELRHMKHYSRYGKQAYKQWADVVAHLCKSSLIPGRLNFFLITRVSHVSEAELILQPLASLPSLKRCGIWLSEIPYLELKDLARVTAERLIMPKAGEENKGDSFRYLDLPLEIRSRILEFSDLCTSADLEWKPPSSLFPPIYSPVCSCYDDLGYIDRDLHFDSCEQPTIVHPNVRGNGLERRYGANRHCCTCLQLPFNSSRDGPSCKLQNDPNMCIFDCASHAAYTAPPQPPFTPYCPPLLLVSRQVRLDALSLFFQRHRFVLTPFSLSPLRDLKEQAHSPQWFAHDPLPRTELSLFLSHIPKEALRHLRHIEWIVAARENFLDEQPSVYHDYLDTIDFMLHALTLPNLTLTLNVRATRSRVMDHATDPADFAWPDSGLREITFYDWILKPLGRLGEQGLGNCWVYLRFLWWNVGRWEAGYWDDDWAVEYSLDAEEAMWEKRIMGDEEYDAVARGKGKERVERLTGVRPRTRGP